MPIRLFAAILLSAVLLSACAPQPAASTTLPTLPADAPPEQPLTLIPLTQPAASASSQFSGADWYGQVLVLLPQYPDVFEGGPQGALMLLPAAEILACLDAADCQPLDPQPLPLFAAGLKAAVPGFEGFEAIAFDGDSVYITIEAHELGGMQGYIIRGQMQPDLAGITLDVGSLTPVNPQAKLSNMSDEALLLTPGGLLSFYEANGANINPQPLAHRFDADLQPLGTLPLPALEYRLTDASRLDENNRFWVINYLYPGDAPKLDLAPDALVAEYGQGATHAASSVVERLVEMEWTPQGIALTDRAPIQLQLLPDNQARNWEGLVRLPGRGFLLITDSFPGTLLAFVAHLP